MATYLIGIDDTDNATSPGTGQLARRLTAELERFGGRPLGTTRHQFLIHPRIPYTGHNRGICVALDWPGDITHLNFIFDLVADWSAEGSDPGVCIAPADSIPAEITRWGERALAEVLTMDEAAALAKTDHLDLRPLGGTGGGIIGALASVGLRAGGNNGRFVDMPGLRSLGHTINTQQLAAMGIHVEHRVSQNSQRSPADSPLQQVYKTHEWVRPRLTRGLPVWTVEWSDHDNAWIPLDRKTVHPSDPG